MTEQSNNEQDPVIIYTDGACHAALGIGGWGATLSRWGKSKELCGSEVSTTNNRMELMAAIKALEALTRSLSVIVYTDSQYVQKGITEWMDNWKQNGWRTTSKKPVKNADLWQRLETAIGFHNVDWRWVKGHSGNAGNERADALATKAMREAF